MARRLMFVCLIIGWISCSNSIHRKPEPKFDSRVLIAADELERAGVEGDALALRLLVEGKIYLLSGADGLLARFSSQGEVERRYRAKGQGPGEFQYPASLFRFDAGTIAVLDIGKDSLLLFDNDLNLKKEMKVPGSRDSSFRKMMRSSGVITAFGDFGENCLAVLNDDLTVNRTFRKKPTVLPFKNLYPSMLYMAYLLDGGEIAATSWVYFSDTCQVDLLDARSGTVTASLHWDHPAPPTQADVTARKNVYGCYGVFKAGDRFVVQTRLTPSLEKPAESIQEWIVFDKSGTLLARMRSKADLIAAHGELDYRLYFMDEDDNISYSEVRGNWPRE